MSQFKHVSILSPNDYFLIVVVFLAVAGLQSSNKGLESSIVVQSHLISCVVKAVISVGIIRTTGSSNKSTIKALGVSLVAGNIVVPSTGSRLVWASATTVMGLNWRVHSKANNKAVSCRAKDVVSLGLSQLKVESIFNAKIRSLEKNNITNNIKS
jgi:hypothetical protein